tara:strand:+ start:18422 stop:18643 length:222 start_codon:yes stop_codon:yes gene_type:complete
LTLANTQKNENNVNENILFIYLKLLPDSYQNGSIHWYDGYGDSAIIIDSKRMLIHIKQPKGKKDRYALLSYSL